MVGENMGTDSPYPCPACGFEVFTEPPGSYGICPVCGWENDEVQPRFPPMWAGANKASLFGGQQRVLQRFPPSVLTHGGYELCPDWRPLTVEQCGDTGGTPQSGLAYFEAVGGEEPVYYWRRRARRGGDS
jgi:hypothetical protein